MSWQTKFLADKTCGCHLLHLEHIIDVNSSRFQKRRYVLRLKWDFRHLPLFSCVKLWRELRTRLAFDRCVVWQRWLNDQTFVRDAMLGEKCLILINCGKPLKCKVERGGLTVKHVLATRCWTKMSSRLARALGLDWKALGTVISVIFRRRTKFKLYLVFKWNLIPCLQLISLFFFSPAVIHPSLFAYGHEIMKAISTWSV